MRIIYMGTPEFALLPLRMLFEEGYDVLAVVTQPDKPKGRKMVLTPPPVKLYVQEHNQANGETIEILQPVKAGDSEFLERIAAYGPDLVITCAYGKILSKRFLDIPKCGTVNVHASLLPKYRGAGPIQWCIINGETKTGVTTMLTDPGMDTGDMLLKKEVDIPPDMTAQELHDVLSAAGAGLLKETLDALIKGRLDPVRQNHGEASYAPMLTKDIGIIDWERSAADIHNLVRGANPWPGVYTSIKGMRVKICKTAVVGLSGECQIGGTIIGMDKTGIYAASGKGTVKILEIQPQSGKKMTADSFMNGYRPEPGDRFL